MMTLILFGLFLTTMAANIATYRVLTKKHPRCTRCQTHAERIGEICLLCWATEIEEDIIKILQRLTADAGCALCLGRGVIETEDGTTRCTCTHDPPSLN